jgi:glutamate-1-semialdehyde 2,1-aminomutase
MAPSTVFTERLEEAPVVVDLVKPPTQSNHADLQAALAAVRERFTKKNPNSLQLHEEAAKSLPGGNTRSLLHTAPFPVYMKEGKGWQLFDEDGHT